MCVSVTTVRRILLELFCISFFVFGGAQAQVVDDARPSAEPERGEDFTDDFKVIVGAGKKLTNVMAIDKSLTVGDAKFEPWSDSYWPTYKGGIAARYSDPSRPNTNSWVSYHSHFLSRPPSAMVASGNISQLSPAEKYDLLIGDSSWALTRSMWEKGAKAMREWGVVSTWTGICHGWAGAIHVGTPRPDKGVTVTDVHNRYTIHFYPFDIMALVSYHYSKMGTGDLFTGRRCRNPAPRREGDRIIDGSCFDANPMTWHLSVVNRLGGEGKPFVMDTSANTQVWNYAIDSYQMSYFNPLTLEHSAVIDDAMVAVENYPNDPYKKYRSPKARYIVGIEMDAFHPGAITPHSGLPVRQNLERKHFVYDLELDANRNIVGGEWHTDTAPDFLWRLPDDSNPYNSPTYAHTLNQNLPVVTAGLAETARRASQSGRLVPDIVFRLLHRSLEHSPGIGEEAELDSNTDNDSEESSEDSTGVEADPEEALP